MRSSGIGNAKGLRGQKAGQTALSTVGKDGVGLTYRGYSIEELAELSSFEEVAYLLMHGELPSREDLAAFRARLVEASLLPVSLRTALEAIPASAHPMDVLRTGCSFLGDLEPEADFSMQSHAGERLLATLPGMMAYWYRFTRDHVRIDTQRRAGDGTAAHILEMLHGRRPEEIDRRAMDVSLILYAEHEFNASTFAARVCASTLSDLHSCIVAAIGTLRGPLHGGANEAALAMLSEYATPEEARRDVLERLEKREKIMGFGHAVYRTADPRNAIIKKWAKRLAESHGSDAFYRISVEVETTMWEAKELFANADFYHASAYRSMEIPGELSTPLFVCSRAAGWIAHVQEQRADNRIIRPDAEYVGPSTRLYPNAQRRALGA